MNLFLSLSLFHFFFFFFEEDKEEEKGGKISWGKERIVAERTRITTNTQTMTAFSLSPSRGGLNKTTKE